MFPGSNSNAGLGYNKHNQYMAQPPHFLAGPNPGTVSGAAVNNTLRSQAPGMPLNMQGSIDWAQLAQQWIHMRDSTPAPQMANFSMTMPIAPPPPIISNEPEYQQTLTELPVQHYKVQTYYQEHGEAEMDMDEDMDENENNGRVLHDIRIAPPPPVATPAQWMGHNTNDVPVVGPNDAAGVGTQPWSNWSSRANPTAHIPSLLKLNVCNPNEQQQQQLMQPMHQHPQHNNCDGNVASSEIDANKRKMLPAWIREGLEKMEREKQRQLERQQQPTTPELESTSAINVKQVSSKTLTTPVNLLNISNVASDSEDSIAAPEEAIHNNRMAQQLIGNDDVLSKTFVSDEELDNDDAPDKELQQHDAVIRGKSTVTRAANAEAALSGKNYEESLADLMLVVRRTLTEILLETTNEEIAAIATETIKAHRAKASSAQVIRKSALSSITGNLGLAAYGDSSSESEEEDDNTDDNNGSQVDHSVDSAAKETDKSTELTADELKARIRKSKRAFEKVIDDIEERVALQEQLDEQKLQHHRKLELKQVKANSEQQRTESPPDDIAATTKMLASSHEKTQLYNGKRLSRKERTTRFSDNKDGKQSHSYVSQVAAVAAAAAQSSVLPPKLKPVPNPATNLLQMPEAMATMLNTAGKTIVKAQKTSKKSKSRRRRSSSSSSSTSSSSSGDNSSSSSSSSGSNSNSNSSKSTTNSSSTRSSLAAKKHGSSSSSRHRQRRDSSSRKKHSETSRDRQRKGHSRSSSSRHSYSLHSSSRDRERDRGRDRERDRHAVHYSSQQQQERRRRHHQRDSSNSGEDGRRSSRHSSSRSRQSSSYGKHRNRTRSRSNSRSTHNSYSSASASTTSRQQRKRH